MKLSAGKIPTGVAVIGASENQAEVFQIRTLEAQLEKLGAAFRRQFVRPGDDPDKATIMFVLPLAGSTKVLPFDSTSVDLTKLPDLLDALSKVVRIVEGTKEKRWVASGRRFKDTPEWAQLYVAINAMKPKEDGDKNRADQSAEKGSGK
jgi:hypothetical protein